MTAKIAIPLAVTEETAPFWDAAKEGRLVAERCNACGAESFPPRGICRTCRSRDTGIADVTGRGTVYSYTVNHQRWMPDLEVPFAIVLVEFANHPGVRVTGRIRGVEPDQVRIGMEVEIGFDEGPDDFMIPSFVAVEEGSS